jgi:hypothetical protein
MVHNGIEYGLMAAYAEGLNILKHANAGKQSRDADAETAPMRNPEDYQYDLNLADIAEVWRRGSVVASWLLDLTAIALFEQSDLSGFSGRVSDSGEGRWTIIAAIDESVPAPVLSAALYQRFSSRGEEDFADKLLSAMRYQFGGHVERSAGQLIHAPPLPCARRGARTHACRVETPLDTLLGSLPPVSVPPTHRNVTGGAVRGLLAAPGAVFKAIPFAAPPLGTLRWREPQPVKPWRGVRDATRYSAACIQNPIGTGVFLAPLARRYGVPFPTPKWDISEDCLYLNIWTPEWPLKSRTP